MRCIKAGGVVQRVDLQFQRKAPAGSARRCGAVLVRRLEVTKSACSSRGKMMKPMAQCHVRPFELQLHRWADF